jgi:syndecan 4
MVKLQLNKETKTGKNSPLKSKTTQKQNTNFLFPTKLVGRGGGVIISMGYRCYPQKLRLVLALILCVIFLLFSSSPAYSKDCFGGAITVADEASCPTCITKCLDGSFKPCGEACPSPTPRRTCPQKCCKVKCAVGVQTCDNQGKAKTCQGGYYLNTIAETCEPCVGTGVQTCDPNNPDIPLTCQTGYWLDSGECKNCLITGVSSCDENGVPTACEAGYGFTGSACSACTTGEYSTGGTDSCASCVVGEVASCNPETGDPQTCLDGYYVFADEDTVSCEPCPAGNSCDGENEPVACGEGQYSAGGDDTCDSCGTGVATCDSDDGDVQTCQAGYYYDSTELTENLKCKPCVAGTCSQAGETSCSSCGTGVASCVSTDCIVQTCQAGNKLISNACMSCEAGEWQIEGSNSTCNPCDDYNSVSGPVTSCDATTGNPTGCVAGKYLNGTSCSECPAGNSCAGGGAAPVQCAAGTYAAGATSVCSACDEGKFSAAQAASCTSCIAPTVGYEQVASCDAATGGAKTCKLAIN